MNPLIKVMPRWQKDFLFHLGKGKPVSVAARLSKVGLDKLNYYRDTDPEFAKQWAELENKNLPTQPLQW